MNKMLLLVIVVVVGAVAIFLNANRRVQGASDTESLKGQPAPAIALKTLDGKDLVLADMKGKVVLIDTWATWCPPCRESLPHVQKVSTDKALADKGLVVWAIDAQESPADVLKFLQDNKYTFSVLMDTKGAVLKSYFISGIPNTIIVGRDGIVKDTFVGYGGEKTAQQIDDALAKALAEPAPK